jgi:hypothetical protein
MTNAHLTRWTKATDDQRTTPRSANMRACLHSAVATMQSCFKAFVAERHESEARGFPAQTVPACNDEGASVSGVRVAPRVELAKIMVGAFAVVAAVVAFDFLVLWVTSGQLIARLPF